MNSAHSIYASMMDTGTRPTLTARLAQRDRAEHRAARALAEGPERRLDRTGPIRALLRAYRSSGDTFALSTLSLLMEDIEAEVLALEAWAESRSPASRRDGQATRQALDFLRTFGRLMTLDLSCVPESDRPQLVGLLALEHRWCYAAAGTTRADFKRATGRTGAR